MNAREKADPDNMTAITFPAEGEMSVQNFEKKTAHNFEFEKVFDPTKDQADIFAEVQDLVVSVMDGYNVCLFASVAGRRRASIGCVMSDLVVGTLSLKLILPLLCVDSFLSSAATDRRDQERRLRSV